MSIIEKLEELLMSGLKGFEFERNGSGNHVKGIISLSFPNKEGEALLHRLDLKGIMVSTGAACNSVQTEISHVLKSVGVEERFAKGTIRISLSKYNTEKEVEHIVKELISILS